MNLDIKTKNCAIRGSKFLYGSVPRLRQSWILEDDMMSLLARMGDEHQTPGYRSKMARIELPAEAGWGRERTTRLEFRRVLFRSHEFEQTLGDSKGQGSLACCSPWGQKESDTIM